MELRDLEQDAKELIDVTLVLDDEGNPVSGFKVVGADSEEYQEADRAWKVKNVQKSARRGHAIQAASETGAMELVNLVAKREFTIAEACIKEIYGFESDGEPALLNSDTLKAIFSKKPTWRTKVVMAIEAEQVFTKASSAAGAK
jgi:hypothetical protein